MIDPKSLHPLQSCMLALLEDERIQVFTPSEENFDPEALTKFLVGDGPNDKTSGKQYIKINAYTREGQKEIAMLNKITNDNKFWDQPLE